MSKIEFFYLKKVVYGLIKDTKGYQIQTFFLSNSFIKKSYDGFTVSSVIIASGLPNLVILGD